MSAEEPWVEVVPHDGRWVELYQAESAAIGAALGAVEDFPANSLNVPRKSIDDTAVFLDQ